MDLRQLEYVVAVADHGGFTAGAAAAHVAQPSLSARVRDLERELGVELFHRVGRGVALSEAGLEVLDHARRVLADVRALRAAAAAIAGLHGGVLDVAALPTLAVDPLADLVGRFRQAWPEVAVRVLDPDEASGPAGVVDLVRSGRAEVGLADLRVAGTDLDEVRLADQELLALLPSAPIGTDSISIRRQRDGRVDLRVLATLPLVLTPRGTSSRQVVDSAFGALGLVPLVAVEVAQRDAIVPLVLAGAGVGFVPGAQAAAARLQGADVRRPDPPLVRRIGLLHRRGRLSPAAAAFLDLARGELR